MDRRRFLTLALGVGGLTVVEACSGGSAKTKVGSPTTTAPGGANPDDWDVIVPNDWEFMTGDYRVAVLLASDKANGAPVPLVSPVTLRIGPANGPYGPPLPTAIHAAGPEPAYALTSFRFTSPGTYNLEATYRGKKTSLPISVIDPKQSEAPAVGAKALAVATPTAAKTLGVNPICTAQPPCAFHRTSLDAALAAHQPVALLFATPALCQSRFCGPVLMNVQSVAQEWLTKVTFIHCEIYTDLSGQTLSPTVQAYGLQHEPMLYLVGPDGVIRTRIDNLFDRDEAHAALVAAFGA